MFPIPYSSPYHPSAPDPNDPTKWVPVTGYDSVATLSPLEDHVNEIEWALSSTWGIGAFALVRSVKLYDGPKSLAAIQKWTAWTKKYVVVGILIVICVVSRSK